MISCLNFFVSAGCCAAIVSSTHAYASDYAMSPIQFPSAFDNNAMSQIGKRYDDPKTNPNAAKDIRELLKYTASVDQTRSNFSKFATSLSSTNPEASKQWLAAFNATDPLIQLAGLLKSYELRADDVSHAYTAWWISTWQAANSTNQEVSSGTAQSMAASAARTMVSSPDFSKLNNAQRQLFAQSMLFRALVIKATIAGFQKDPKMLQQFATSVKDDAKANGLRLDVLVSTNQGIKFLPK